MTDTIRFAAPTSPLTMNQRTHWAVRARTVKAWRTAANMAACAQLGRGPARRRRPASLVRVTFPVAQVRRRDPHNWAPTVKAIIDGLVDAGVWPDDTDEWVIVLDPRFHREADVIVELVPQATVLEVG